MCVCVCVCVYVLTGRLALGQRWRGRLMTVGVWCEAAVAEQETCRARRAIGCLAGLVGSLAITTNPWWWLQGSEGTGRQGST